MARRPKSKVSAEEIAKHCRTTTGFMNLIFLDLKKASLITSKKGPSGGYSLDIPFTELTLDKIIRATDNLTNKSIDEAIENSSNDEVKTDLLNLENSFVSIYNRGFTKLTIKELL